MSKIFFASDHGWYKLKEELFIYCKAQWFEVENLWVFNEKSVDYPDIAKILCEKVIFEAWIWVLLCWTWIGVSIAANKIKWIRAALVHNEYEAIMARKHNNANIICFWWRTIWIEIAKFCLNKFLNEEFEWWRHEIRVEKIMKLEM